MSLKGRLRYYQRIIAAYLTHSKSQLTFWHGKPRVNERLQPDRLGEYYMPFLAKADYLGHYDEQGIPMLDYHGAIGLQYNPIAIAQYGLGNCNYYYRTKDPERRRKFLAVAGWLVDNLEQNPAGVWVWNHHFDWEYRTPLRAPWYSALAQGQGISLLVRAHQETEQCAYLEAARCAFESFRKTTDEGGITHIDEEGYVWFEETVVDPPTHILNGFLWASWGLYDYFLHTQDKESERLFDEAVRTLHAKLPCFDTGFWSLYEQSGTRMKMLASPFYHRLHIVQLRVMYRLTEKAIFAEYADRWNTYQNSSIRHNLATGYKALFKLLYY